MSSFDVLFIDDDQLTIDAAVMHLKLQHKTVMTAYSADEAIAILGDHSFGVIVLDVMFAPGNTFSQVETADGRYTGLRLLELIRSDPRFSSNENAKIVLATNWRDEPQVDEVANRLKVEVIRKPLDISKISRIAGLKL